MNLHELAIKYSSDKAQHGYCPFYEQRLPKNPKKLLGIGVLHGASIRMWQEYFPECEIHGLDLFIENQIPDIPGVVWHKGHQCDYFLLESLRNENFDIIIDDGSHNSRDQLITFFGLYSGNHYFIEDIQCNDEDFYSQGLPAEMRVKTLFDSEKHLGVIYDQNSPIVLL
jgi:hypothetical protein